MFGCFEVVKDFFINLECFLRLVLTSFTTFLLDYLVTVISAFVIFSIFYYSMIHKDNILRRNFLFWKENRTYYTNLLAINFKVDRHPNKEMVTSFELKTDEPTLYKSLVEDNEYSFVIHSESVAAGKSSMLISQLLDYSVKAKANGRINDIIINFNLNHYSSNDFVKDLLIELINSLNKNWDIAFPLNKIKFFIKNYKTIDFTMVDNFFVSGQVIEYLNKRYSKQFRDGDNKPYVIIALDELERLEDGNLSPLIHFIATLKTLHFIKFVFVYTEDWYGSKDNELKKVAVLTDE